MAYSLLLKAVFVLLSALTFGLSALYWLAACSVKLEAYSLPY